MEPNAAPLLPRGSRGPLRGLLLFALLALGLAALFVSTAPARARAVEQTDPLPDLTIEKTDSGGFYQGQNGAIYKLKVKNVGSMASNGEITVVDNLPAGLTYASFTSAVAGWWTCSYQPETRQVTCIANPELGVRPEYYAPEIQIIVNIDINAPPLLTNTAFVAGGGDSNPANNEVALETQVAGRPDLTISKAHKGDFTQGQSEAVYTLTVSNIGSVTSGNLTVTDTLPDGLVYLNYEGLGWFCDSIPGQVTCTKSPGLVPDTSSTLLLKVRVLENAPLYVVNSAVVSTSTSLPDRDQSNNNASDPTNIYPAVDLTIEKMHEGDFRQGRTGVYTVTVSNVGPGQTAGEVTVTDTLPDSLSALSLSGDGWNCDIDILQCARSDGLEAGASYPLITLTVQVASDAPAQVTNTATVTGSGDAIPANNTASDPTNIIPAPDLAIAIFPQSSFRQGMTGAKYTVRVNNAGAGATFEPVTVVLAVPSELQFAGLSGTGWVCDPIWLTCTRNNALQPYQEYADIELMVDIPADAPVEVQTGASVTGGGELNTSNNSDTDITPIQQVADLTITKSHSGSIYRSQTGTYTITVSNVGPGGTLGEVKVQEHPPAGLTVTSMTGTGWVCDNLQMTCKRQDPMAADATFPAITVGVQVAQNAPSTVVNVAEVSGGGELNKANNEATDSTTTLPYIDLKLEKTHTGVIRQGQNAIYSLLVTNIGASQSGGTVTVTDQLPAGLTPVSISGDGWECVLETLTCTRSDALGTGQNYPAITLEVRVAADLIEVTNTAGVSGGGDANPDNNTASDRVQVVLSPDLAVVKSHTGAFLRGQTGASYTITVSNQGMGATSGTVTVSDLLPVGLSATSLQGEGWSCAIETLTCTRSDALATGASYPVLTLLVDVAADAATSLTNRADVSVDFDTDLSNNQVEDPTVVYFPPEITQQPVSMTICAGLEMMLSAKGTGNPAPEIQWQVSLDDGLTWNDLSGETATNLTRTAEASMDGNLYRAVFTNAAGSTDSTAVPLVVNSAPDFTGQPQDADVLFGAPITFSAVVTGKPTPVLQWQTSPDGSDWSDLPGESSPTLAFTAWQNGGYYRAVAANICGSASSRAAFLSVQVFTQYLPLLRQD